MYSYRLNDKQINIDTYVITNQKHSNISKSLEAKFMIMNNSVKYNKNNFKIKGRYFQEV